MLFNNAIYKGVGTLDRVADLTPESMLDMFTGNFVHQVLLIQAVLPHMLERGRGTIIDMVSGSARLDPQAPPGEGGWGILYSGSKAAFARVAGGINAEYLSAGIKAFNVDPGNVVTEARKAIKTRRRVLGRVRERAGRGHGKVVAWLATDPGADRFLGKWIFAPKLCSDLGLLPDWTVRAGRLTERTNDQPEQAVHRDAPEEPEQGRLDLRRDARLGGVLRHPGPREGARHGRRPSVPELVHGPRRRHAQAADQRAATGGAAEAGG